MDWSNLPNDLLSEIFNRIDDRFDILVLRLLCRSWHAAIALPEFSNGAVLSPILPHRIKSKNLAIQPCTCFYFASNIYLFKPRGRDISEQQRSPKFWLAMIDEIAPGRLLLRHPLSTFPVKNWPAGFPKTLSLSNLHVIEVHKSISFRNGCSGNNEGFDKVLMFENCGPGQSGGIIFAGLEKRGVFLLYYTSTCKVYRAFGTFVDIVPYKGKVFGISANGRGYIVDCRGSLDMSEIVSRLPMVSRRKKRLVESNGDVYLVIMYKQVTDLKVYKLDEKIRMWVEIKSIGDLSFFLTFDCSFALSSKHCTGFEGNCIYMCEDTFRANEGEDDANINNEDWHRHISIFRFDDRTVIENKDSYDFLWPPPAWLYTS